ncbi:MAG TPA: DUF2007 domain-containing protein [Anaerolineae bacterium]
MFGPRNVKREGLQVVYRASGLLSAQVIKGRLEASGIPAVLDYEAVGAGMGMTFDGLGEVRVLVPIERAEEARELIEVGGDEDVVDFDEQEGR